MPIIAYFPGEKVYRNSMQPTFELKNIRDSVLQHLF